MLRFQNFTHHRKLYIEHSHGWHCNEALALHRKFDRTFTSRVYIRKSLSIPDPIERKKLIKIFRKAKEIQKTLDDGSPLKQGDAVIKNHVEEVISTLSQETPTIVQHHFVEEPKKVKIKERQEEHEPAGLDVVAFSKSMIKFVKDRGPSREEYQQRLQMHQRLEKWIKKLYPGSYLLTFGSVATNLFGPDSDVDYTLILPTQVDERYEVDVIYAVADMLHDRGIYVNTIPGARVPIVQNRHITDSTPFCFDISINRPLSYWDAKLVRSYVELDERVRPLIFCLKAWAKQAGIHLPEYLSSFCLNMMAIFYLQNCNPPVLPCLQKDVDKKEDLVDGYNVHFERDIKWKSENTETIAGLLEGFFLYYYKFPYMNDAISVREGTAIESDFPIHIQSPFQPEFNCARLIKTANLRTLVTQFKRAYSILYHESPAKFVEFLRQVRTTAARPARRFYRR